MEKTADYVLGRLREWGVHRVYGYPGDGINGFPGAYNRAGGRPSFIFCVFNNQDLNQVTWEQRAEAGDPKFPGSQDVPDVPYHKYAELLGLRGIYCGKPGDVGRAWDEALASDVPVVLEFRTDPEVPPPPHIMKDQAKKSVKAEIRDPQKMGLLKHGFRQKMTEYYEKLPGRNG